MPKKSDSLSLEDGEVSAKIEECLLNVKNDTSFMEGGPPADQFHKIHSLDDIGPFMTYVAQSLAGSKKQKKVEKYVQFLEQGIDKWKDVIKNFDPQKTTRPATNGTSASMQESDLDTTHTKTRKRSLEPNPPGQATKKPRNEDESTTNATAKSQKGKQATTTKKKKKAKRRASKDNQGSKVITFSENEKHEFAKRSKSEYLAMKEDILEGLSDKYKSQFGQVVFAKWQKMWRPVLIVSPFDVDPNSRMRQDWMTMYKNTRERQESRWYLLYWYGSAQDIAFTYSQKSNIISYEQGVKRGLNKPPPSIQKKIDANKKLTKSDTEHVESLKLAEAARQLPIEERRRPIPFMEDYELLLTFDGKANLDDDDDDDDSSEDDDSNGASEDGDNDDDDDDDDEQPIARMKANKLKKKKKRSSSTPPTTPSTKKLKRQASPGVDSLDFVEKELTSSDDDDDDDEEEEEEAELPDDDDDDDDDEEFVQPKPKTKKQKAKGEKPAKEAKETKKKKESPPRKQKAPTKAKSEDGTKGKKNPKKKSKGAALKKQDERALQRQAQKAFEKNEDDFLPTLGTWSEAIGKEDKATIETVFEKIREQHCASLSIAFLKAYDIVKLLKDSKQILGRDSVLYKEVWSAMKKSYEAGVHLELKSFQPVKRAEREARLAASKARAAERAEKAAAAATAAASEPKQQQQQQQQQQEPEKPPTDAAIPPKKENQEKGGGSLDDHQLDRQASSSSQNHKPSHRTQEQRPAKAPGEQKPTKTSVNKSKRSLKSLLSGSKTKEKKKEPAAKDPVSSNGETKPAPVPWFKLPVPPPNPAVAATAFRVMGLEFLEEVCEYFPADQVNRQTVARSLEAAVHKWASSQPRLETKYWGKLHLLVAALAGKVEGGTLLGQIVAGRYHTVDDVVRLSDEVLAKSYEG